MMRRILVTGGTVFVSRYVANYFAQKGDDVYVLNRNSKPQLPNVTLIEGDRNDLGEKLKGYEFDAVLDITAYTREHVENLVNALGKFGDYMLCYDAVGADLETVSVEGHPQRAYFCFHDYDYYLDVTKQMTLMSDVKPLAEGLKESYQWFIQNRDAVMRRPYMEYIDANI